MPTVGETDSPQQRVADLTVVFRLLYDRRQLFVITDQDEFVDAAMVALMSRQQSDDIWFQNLTGLIYDSQGEMFQIEDLRMT